MAQAMFCIFPKNNLSSYLIAARSLFWAKHVPSSVLLSTTHDMYSNYIVPGMKSLYIGAVFPRGSGMVEMYKDDSETDRSINNLGKRIKSANISMSVPRI